MARWERRLLLILLSICCVLAAAAAAGLRINSTPSLPLGIWLIERLQAPIVRGDIVLFCFSLTAPPETDCPAGAAHLLKPVLAIGGDRVEIGEEGVSINGEPIAHSRALAGRFLPCRLAHTGWQQTNCGSWQRIT